MCLFIQQNHSDVWSLLISIEGMWITGLNIICHSGAHKHLFIDPEHFIFICIIFFSKNIGIRKTLTTLFLQFLSFPGTFSQTYVHANKVNVLIFIH